MEKENNSANQKPATDHQIDPKAPQPELNPVTPAPVVEPLPSLVKSLETPETLPIPKNPSKFSGKSPKANTQKKFKPCNCEKRYF